jgi:putative Mg2+ transporter-C (MgtC) family protein
MRWLLIEPTGQDWTQFAELGCALLLSALIGLEREVRQKSAGLRTHTLIGFSSALIMLVSKYGFTDVLGDHTVLDPSRVAAQIVSGIGFIGGGLIFVRKDAVRGLTTAASVWLTTAVGMAAGAGLLLLAAATTAGYFLVVHGFTPVTERLRRSRPATRTVQVTYRDGRGLLRGILNACTGQGWLVAHISTRHHAGRSAVLAAHNLSRRDREPDPDDLSELDASDLDADGYDGAPDTGDAVSVVVQLRGTGDFEALTAVLTEMPGVLALEATTITDEESGAD